jgi:diaminopimelate epimerase
MSGIEYYRASGSGNDFLALVEPATEPTSEDIRAWCRRGISLGADGLFTLHRRPGGVEMRYYNGGDGALAELCVNGTRCAAQLAFLLGWAEGEVGVLTGAGPLRARRRSDSQIELELPPPGEGPEAVVVEAAGRSWGGHFLTVGVPHLILPWPESLETAPVASAGPALRRHSQFPRGANVSFVRFPDPHRLEIRTFERGVEAETLACGTGVLAATLVGLSDGTCRLPVTALTLGGLELEVGGHLNPPARLEFSWAGIWTLTGDARILAQGKLLPGAAESPEPASWSR